MTIFDKYNGYAALVGEEKNEGVIVEGWTYANNHGEPTVRFLVRWKSGELDMVDMGRTSVTLQ